MLVRRVSRAARVGDVRAAAAFYVDHLGFRPIMVEDYVVKLLQPDTDAELVFLPGTAADGVADGVTVVLEVADVRAEVERLTAAGVATGPVEDEQWGERLCLLRDPNGITVQLVQWLGERPS